MAWKDILKRRKFNDPRKGKKGGLTDEQRRKFYGYGGSKAAEEAKRKRDAIFNNPELKEKVRINKLKDKAESKLKKLDESVKAVEYEVKYLEENYTWPPKPEEHDAGLEWEKSRDITEESFYNMIAEMERMRGYADFLRKSIKSNFEGVSMNEYQEKNGNMYSIRIDDGLGLSGSIYEGEELGDWEKRTKEVFNRLMRKLGWNDKVRKL